MMDMANLQAFTKVDTWIFDLDNTLYPAHCNLFAQVDLRMGEFISARLNVDRAQAKQIQKGFYRDYGTTLRGLMSEHSVAPREFLDYVHDIDLAPIEPDEELCASIASLPGKKYIFTNGSRAHAENVAGKIGVLSHFDDVFDIEASNYVPKPNEASYAAFLDRFNAHGRPAAMFEDLSRNLEVPARLGMITVLVKARAGTHPDAAAKWVNPEEPGAHVNHTTDDLNSFLTSVIATLPGA